MEVGIGITEGLAWGIKVNTWICVVANTLMFASVLQKVVVVCKTKDYTLLPWPMNIVTIFCSTCWVAYVTLKNQKFLMIPGVFGDASGLMGIILYMVYRAKALKNAKKTIPSTPANESFSNLAVLESNADSPKKEEAPLKDQVDSSNKK